MQGFRVHMCWARVGQGHGGSGQGLRSANVGECTFSYHTSAPLASTTRLFDDASPVTDAPLVEAHCEDATARGPCWTLFEVDGSFSSRSRTILSRIRIDGRLRFDLALMDDALRKKAGGTCAPPPCTAANTRRGCMSVGRQ